MRKSILGVTMAGLLLLTGCSIFTHAASSGELKITEAELTDNEELLFSIATLDTYLYDLEGQFPAGKEVSFGIDYYHFGELKDEIEITSLYSDPQENHSSTNYEKMSIILSEGKNEVEGDFRLSQDGAATNSVFSLEKLDDEGKSYSSDTLLNGETLTINKDSSEKQYLALYLISPNTAMRTFDLAHALKPNDDYETMYLFYVEINDSPEDQ